MTYKQLTACVLAFALALAVVVSGGFGASELDRNTTITVVENDRAAVGLQACYLPNEASHQTSGGEDTEGSETGNDGGQTESVTPVSVEITNRLGSELAVRELTVDGAIVNDRSYAMRIAAGDHERVTVPVRSEPREVTAIVSANGVSTRITVSDISHDGCPFPVTLPSPEGSENGVNANSGNYNYENTNSRPSNSDGEPGSDGETDKSR